MGIHLLFLAVAKIGLSESIPWLPMSVMMGLVLVIDWDETEPEPERQTVQGQV